MALSTLSLGILTLLAFVIANLSLGLDSISVPAILTAICISLPILENCLALFLSWAPFRN